MVEFDPYDPDFANDPYPVYKRLRDEAPVYFCAKRNFWALSRYSDVVEAHQDYARFSSSGGVTIEGIDAGAPLLIVKDPPEHRWHKALVAKVFTPARMATLAPFIKSLVTRLLDEVAEDAEFDMVEDFALQVPLQVISELIGIPKEYRAEIHHLADKALRRGDETDLANQASASEAARAIYREIIRNRRARPGDDPISILIAAQFEDNQGLVRGLTDHEMSFRFAEMATAGHETVAKAIPTGALAFQLFPAEKRRSVENPALLKNAIEEILRYDPPSQLRGRTTTQDVYLHGTTIPAGSKTMLLTGAATRDERRFEQPDIFNITREPAPEGIYFGVGVHRCLGVHLARLELNCPPSGTAWAGFVVPDIDKTLSAVEAAGGRIEVPVHGNPEHHVRAAIAADPEGHLIEIIQMVPTA